MDFTATTTMLIVLSLLYGIEKMVLARPTLEDSLRIAVWLVVGFLLYFFGAEIVSSGLADYFSNSLEKYSGNHKYMLAYCGVVVAVTATGWFILARWFIPASSVSGTFLLVVGSVLFGIDMLSQQISYLQAVVRAETGVDHYFYILVGLFILAISAWMIKINEEIQNYIAIPVGASVLACIWGYIYFHATGINLMSGIEGYDQHYAYGPFIIVAILVLYSTIFHRTKKWHERGSYKALAMFAVLGMLYGIFSSGAYLIGATNPVEWKRAQMINKGLKLQLKAKTEDQALPQKAYTVIIDGKSYTKTVEWADNIISSSNPSLKDIEIAVAIAKVSGEKVSEIVENQEGLRYTGNTGRFIKLGDGIIKSTIKATGDLIDYGKSLMPENKKSSTGQKTVRLPAKVYSIGPHTLSLGSEQITDHWIVFPKNTNCKFFINSEDEKFIMYFDSGEVVTGWGPEPIPQKNRYKFRIKSISGKPIKLLVKEV